MRGGGDGEVSGDGVSIVAAKVAASSSAEGPGAAGVAELLRHVGYGDELGGGGRLARTPTRVCEYFAAATAGRDADLSAILATGLFPSDGYDGVIAVDNLFFNSHCEHHLSAISGWVHIAYKPEKLLVGVGRLGVLVGAVAAQLQLQERLTKQLADVIEEVVQPQGLVVVVSARQYCMISREPKQFNSMMHTSIRRGCLAADTTFQDYFLAMSKK